MSKPGKFSKLCLTKNPNKNFTSSPGKININNNENLLTDDESDEENIINSNKINIPSSNPIFSSTYGSDSSKTKKVKQEPEESNSSDETYCSEIENNKNSSNLFPSQSQPAENNALQSQNLDNNALELNHSGASFSQPLLLQTDSIVETTLDKNQTYLDDFERNVLPKLCEREKESFCEKAEGELPEKHHNRSVGNNTTIADTEPGTQYDRTDENRSDDESIADTEPATQQNQNDDGLGEILELQNCSIEDKDSSIADTEPATQQDRNDGHQSDDGLGEILEIQNCSIDEKDESIADTEPATQQEKVDLPKDDKSEKSLSKKSVVTLSSSNDENSMSPNNNTNDQSQSSCDGSPIVISDSEEEADSSKLSYIVSSLDSTNSLTKMNAFFDNIPLLSTPMTKNYMKNFGPVREASSEDESITQERMHKNMDNNSFEVISESVHEEDEEAGEKDDTEKDETEKEKEKEDEDKNSQEPNSPGNSPSNDKSSSDSNSVDNITEINITANIKISIKIKDDDKASNTSQIKVVTPSSTNKSVHINTGTKPKTPGSSKTPKSPARTKEAKHLKDKQNQNVKNAIDEGESLVLDEFAASVMDEIYGKDQWQTPQIKVKCVKKVTTNTDTKSCNRNINTNIPSSASASAYRTKPTKTNTPKSINRPKALAICDSDTPSSNSGSDSDSSWNCENSPESSPDSDDERVKKDKNRHVPKRNREIRPPNYEIEDSAKPDKTKNQHKPQVQTKTKRTLFNPDKTFEDESDGDEEIPPIQETSPEKRDMDHDISRIMEDVLSIRHESNVFLPKAITRLRDVPKKPTPAKVTKSKPVNNQQVKCSFLKSLEVTTPEEMCDPEALRFRKNYKNLKEDLTQKLFDLYNALIFENELVVPCLWNKKLLNTAGRCHLLREKGLRKARIELSEKVLTSADRLRCTLIHEMCHAATWVFNGEDGHGRTWKQWALKSNNTLPELPKINTCHSYEIFYKYTYRCTGCGAKSQAHSRSKKVENIRCRVCHSAIEILLNKINKDGEVSSTPAKSATGFAKYVKMHYKNVKRPNLEHKDVMRLLSEDFGKLSVDQKAQFN